MGRLRYVARALTLAAVLAAGSVRAQVPQPVIFDKGVVSAAEFDKSKPVELSPGMIVSVYGHSLSDLSKGVGGVCEPVSLPLPTTMCGTTVRVNGVAAPLFYTSVGQVNLQLPPTTLLGLASVVVDVNGVQSQAQSVSVPSVAVPSCFAFPVSGKPLAAQDTSNNYRPIEHGKLGGAPIRPGGIMAAYCTGFAPGVTAGDVTGTLRTPDGQSHNMTVLYAGPSGFVGLTQINAMVPVMLPTTAGSVSFSNHGRSSMPLDTLVARDPARYLAGRFTDLNGEQQVFAGMCLGQLFQTSQFGNFVVDNNNGGTCIVDQASSIVYDLFSLPVTATRSTLFQQMTRHVEDLTSLFDYIPNPATPFTQPPEKSYFKPGSTPMNTSMLLDYSNTYFGRGSHDSFIQIANYMPGQSGYVPVYLDASLSQQFRDRITSACPTPWGDKTKLVTTEPTGGVYLKVVATPNLGALGTYGLSIDRTYVQSGNGYVLTIGTGTVRLATFLTPDIVCVILTHEIGHMVLGHTDSPKQIMYGGGLSTGSLRTSTSAPPFEQALMNQRALQDPENFIASAHSWTQTTRLLGTAAKTSDYPISDLFFSPAPDGGEPQQNTSYSTQGTIKYQKRLDGNDVMTIRRHCNDWECWDTVEIKEQDAVEYRSPVNSYRTTPFVSPAKKE